MNNAALLEGLKRVGIFVLVDALAYVAQNVGQWQIDPTLTAVILIVIPALTQTIYAVSDQKRADAGRVLPSDVGYRELVAYRAEPKGVIRG